MLGDLQMYASTLEVCATVHRINCIDRYDNRGLTAIARKFCESEMLSPRRRARVDQKVSPRSLCIVRWKLCWFVLHKRVCILDKKTCEKENRYWPTMGWYPETLQVTKGLAFLEPLVPKFRISGDTLYDTKYYHISGETVKVDVLCAQCPCPINPATRSNI